MTPLLGRGLELLALLVCTIGTPIGLMAGFKRSPQLLGLARKLALFYAAVMVAATGLMEWALLTNDFSVSYVAHVGSIATPPTIKIVSLWSSLDGSILFWGLILGCFTGAVALMHRKGHEEYLGYTIGVMFFIGIFFSFLIAGPADPFSATPLPLPLDGPGPNPLLQNHLLMIVHPPMLYLGYVGMSVPFAMSIAALLRGNLSASWLRPMRNWLLIPTIFLTLGIMLGGWWSYEVLGWGGYWAWDPVENASFLPWLTAIAALHSALVLERKGTLKAWTVILIQVTFLLTILGTFLTRSGVVNSVHSFTQTPIGPLFLGFLGVLLIGVVVILSMRLDALVGEPADETLVSRDGTFLLNNLILVAIMLTVLIGTIFPILAEAVRGVKVSVGEPYFNRMAVPMFLALLFLMGIGPALPWGRPTSAQLRRALLRPLPAALIFALVCFAFGGRAPIVLLAAFLAGFTTWVSFDQTLKPARARHDKGEGWGDAVSGSLKRTPRRTGGYIVHIGLVMTAVAITISGTYQTSSEATMRPGDEMEVSGYTLRFLGAEDVQEAHRISRQARVQVFRGDKDLGTLAPSLNDYPSQREPVGSPAVRTSLSHDLYLTVMSIRPDGSTGIRSIVTPAVAWIWIGVFVMSGGMTICLLPPAGRRRKADAAP